VFQDLLVHAAPARRSPAVAVKHRVRPESRLPDPKTDSSESWTFFPPTLSALRVCVSDRRNPATAGFHSSLSANLVSMSAGLFKHLYSIMQDER
jgi:hypothetical protein